MYQTVSDNKKLGNIVLIETFCEKIIYHMPPLYYIKVFSYSLLSFQFSAFLKCNKIFLLQRSFADFPPSAIF